MNVSQPAPDPVDAEAEIAAIEQHVRELTMAIGDAQQKLQNLAYRRCYLEGVIGHARTFDAANVVRLVDGEPQEKE